jgi:putative oxidoreductase
MNSLYAGMERFRPTVLSILRIVAALLFLQHGLSKVFCFPFLETVGALLLLVGAYTRIVAFILSGEMAFAYFMAHAPRSFYPLANGGEGAILFCFIFLYIAFAGGGSWSVDRVVLKQV